MATTILYVEDNIFSVSLMKLCLQKRPDYTLLVAEDGKTAWDMVLHYKPDLILMDINLPDTTGWELSRRLRETASMQHIPIIAVTSLNRERSLQNSRDAGINLHLNKAMIHTKLIPNIDKLLSGIPL